MEIIDSIDKIKTVITEFQSKGKTVALVPTMGKLHKGHEELIKNGKSRADVTVVSNFLNTIQFGLNDRMEKYPEDLEQTVKVCEEGGVDILFMPETKVIYPQGFSTFLQEESVSKKLSGPSRPHLFKGYATSMVILMNIVRPRYLVLGQKDIHQTSVIKKIVKDLRYDTEIVVNPIVRDENGVAFGISNAYLEDAQRAEARKLYEGILRAKKMVDGGTRSVERIIAEVTHHLGQSFRLRIVYVAIVNPETMEAMLTIVPGESLLMISVWLDQVRLNDNGIL